MFAAIKYPLNKQPQDINQVHTGKYLKSARESLKHSYVRLEIKVVRNANSPPFVFLFFYGDQALAYGEFYQFSHIIRTQFVHNLPPISVDRFGAFMKLCRDCFG